MTGITRKQICEGVYFTAIADSRFKSNLLSVSFMLPLDRKTAAVNALLPLVLKRGCKEYPDMTALNGKLKDLYGAKIDGGVEKLGEIQVVTLLCGFLSDSYALGGEKITEECAALLKSVIFTPAVENGAFKASDVEIERRNLVDLIDSRLNEKRQYANRRLKEEMCKNETYGVDELGTREQAGKVTPDELFAAWRTMIGSAKAEIVFIGEGDYSACETMFADAFSTVRKKEIMSFHTNVIREAGKVKTITETLPVSQAKLVMGFRAGSAVPDADVAAMQLACTIFGGSPHAKLFINVREKLSLCYYCYSRYERLKGLIIVDSGIERENFGKARDEILKQLKAVQDGNFTDNEIQSALLSIKNSYMELSDSLLGLNSWYIAQAIAGSIRSPEDAAEEISRVSRGEIVGAAKKICLDTIYLLSGTDEGADKT